MPNRILPLTLVSLVVACDPVAEPELELVDSPTIEFRRDDGECADFTTISLNTTYRKNGYPPPYPFYAGEVFAEMPAEWQAAYDEDVAHSTVDLLEAIYVSRETTPAECEAACAEMDQTWTGGACALDLVMARTEPQATLDGYDESARWNAVVEASAQMACACG